MEKEKINLMKERIQEQISKIDNKDFTFYFYVVDTKGVPCGSLSYIYDIAYGLKLMGYNVGIMHNEVDFVGVEGWLGSEYSELPHYNVDKNTVDVSPSDFLFIPEVYTNVMTATKKLPCQRVVLYQNFDKLTEFIPFGATWGDLGIFKAITTSEKNAKILKQFFPYTTIDVVTPKISKEFYNDKNTNKKLIVNLVTREPGDINKIVKPFFWQYPMYKWVAFRDLRGLSRKEFANSLREAAITIWVDDSTNFGYVPLEAMKSGSLVIGKIPEIEPEWIIENSEDHFDLSSAGIWVENLINLPSVLASVIRTWTMDEIPSTIQESADKLVEKYTQGKQLEDIKNVIIDKLVVGRKNEFIQTLEKLNNQENK